MKRTIFVLAGTLVAASTASSILGQDLSRAGSRPHARWIEKDVAAFVTGTFITSELHGAAHLLQPAAPARASELLDTLMATKQASDGLAFYVTPGFFRSRDGETYVPLLFEVDDGILEAAGSVLDVSFFGALESLDGELVARFEERAELGAEPGEGGPIRFEIPLQAPPGNYTAYLGVLDEIGGASGSRVGAIRVPQFYGDDISVSSILLYDAANKTTEPSGTPGHAFQFAGIKLDPIGHRAFRTSDDLGVFFYVYGAGGTDVTARYVFYRDGVEKGQTKPRPLHAAEGVALALDAIPLGSFEPGAYRILIQIEDQATGKTLERRESFTLEP